MKLNVKMKKPEQKYQVGQKIPVGNNTLRIMAYSEGYYMARWKGAIPFAVHHSRIDVKIDATRNAYLSVNQLTKDKK